MKNSKIEREFMSVPEFAERLGISKDHAWKIVWAKQIDILRVGRRVLISYGVFDKYLKKNTTKAIG